MRVLILVLMEHTLGDFENMSVDEILSCLNPCFNGTYSRRIIVLKQLKLKLISLNPCFNGTYSRSYDLGVTDVIPKSLNPCFNGTYSRRVVQKGECAGYILS